jgi:hypothetical protein
VAGLCLYLSHVAAAVRRVEPARGPEDIVFPGFAPT